MWITAVGLASCGTGTPSRPKHTVGHGFVVVLVGWVADLLR